MRCCRGGAVSAVLLLALPLAGLSSRAQEVSMPSLHHRSNAESAGWNEGSEKFAVRQPSTLPRDVSGSYHFDRDNESIEIDIVRGRLSGYISRLGDAETDANTPLTYFFDKSSVNGSEIAFQTRVLHGMWYSFRGTILRGRAKAREDDGYYVLHGVLEEHHPQDADEKSANETVEKRTVNFKSMGE